MQQIIYFFIRNKNFLLFAVLFFLSVVLTIRTHSFHNSAFASSANFLSGGIYSVKSSITAYFGLETENQKLVDENIRLRKTLESYKRLSDPRLDTVFPSEKFQYISAKVINNSYSKTRNQLTLNKGSNDSIEKEMGVITTKGIVGVISNTSKNYATVRSILNTNSQVSAKLKKSNHAGFLVWDGENPNIVQLTDVPRLAPILVGDTIVTDGKSTIFPRDMLIGTIKDYRLNDADDYYQLDVLLFDDMTNLSNVYAIENREAIEIKQLENPDNNAEQ